MAKESNTAALSGFRIWPEVWWRIKGRYIVEAKPEAVLELLKSICAAQSFLDLSIPDNQTVKRIPAVATKLSEAALGTLSFDFVACLRQIAT